MHQPRATISSLCPAPPALTTVKCSDKAAMILSSSAEPINTLGFSSNGLETGLEVTELAW